MSARVRGPYRALSRRHYPPAAHRPRKECTPLCCGELAGWPVLRYSARGSYSASFPALKRAVGQPCTTSGCLESRPFPEQAVHFQNYAITNAQLVTGPRSPPCFDCPRRGVKSRPGPPDGLLAASWRRGGLSTGTKPGNVAYTPGGSSPALVGKNKFRVPCWVILADGSVSGLSKNRPREPVWPCRCLDAAGKDRVQAPTPGRGGFRPPPKSQHVPGHRVPCPGPPRAVRHETSRAMLPPRGRSCPGCVPWLTASSVSPSVVR